MSSYFTILFLAESSRDCEKRNLSRRVVLNREFLMTLTWAWMILSSSTPWLDSARDAVERLISKLDGWVGSHDIERVLYFNDADLNTSLSGDQDIYNISSFQSEPFSYLLLRSCPSMSHPGIFPRELVFQDANSSYMHPLRRVRSIVPRTSWLKQVRSRWKTSAQFLS